MAKPGAVVGAALAAVAGAAVGIVALSKGGSSPRGEHAAYVKPRPAPSAEAFDKGGVPLEDAAMLERLLDLARAVQQTDGRIAGAQLPDLTDRGKPLGDAWELLTDAIEQWAARDSADRPGHEDELRAVSKAFDQALIDARLGYQIAVRFGGTSTSRQLAIAVYRVTDVSFVSGKRILAVRSLDHNGARGALGMELADVGPILMSDATASYALTDVLPVMRPDAPFPLGDVGWRSRGGKHLAASAGAAVRGELGSALGRDAVPATDVATLLAERDAILVKWKAVPMHFTGLYLPPAMREAADDEPRDQKSRVDDIEAELDKLEAERLVSRLDDLLQVSVRRHEAEHAFDRPLPYPQALADVAGPEEDPDTHEPRVMIRFAKAELDAYLAQLLTDPVTPQLTVWGVATFAYGTSSTTPEARAGTVIVTGLARHLGLARAPETADRTWLELAGERVAKASSAELHTAAVELWNELYPGVPVPELAP